ncbi:unnamed protein product, partial [Onchocerca ochengi]|uniref:Uncharacterized protein n=1 Tax=Onchocerca ochengi TaxID=42157 RepID=A0A182EFS7_ONCOC
MQAIVLESDGSNTIGNEAEMSNNSETNVQHPVE